MRRPVIRVLIATALLLLLPAVAMLLTDDMNWGLEDFAAAGALLLGTGLLFELVLWKVKAATYRIAIGAALAMALLLTWAHLAVGIF